MYASTDSCLLRRGEPWFPVFGEYHFSRSSPEHWAAELAKMAAGGVTVVSTYVFWIHHEELRGEFDFTGCRDLRRFLEAAQSVGLPVLLRIGPWVHGECRGGGFPDWLLDSGVPLRSNHPAYLALVREYWSRLAGECAGMMEQDGGPVIGVQIENECGHVGGPQGDEGKAHIEALTALARELGFVVPYYTATAWGGAVWADCLPVYSGYCEAPWALTAEALPANPNFVFSPHRDDDCIDRAHRLGEDLPAEYEGPYLVTELGGGIQPTRRRRPVPTGKDIAAMTLAKLGSGAAGLGYYMYHGGSNPKGRASTLQESTARGEYCDLPEINYDFFAPLGQFGTANDTYRELRLLALFVKDFGGDLAPLPAEIDPERVSPEDTETLRVAWRHDGSHGYVFVNNYQRCREMAAHRGVELVGRCDEPVAFPAMDIDPGEFFFFPYRLSLGDAVLERAAATPLCQLDGPEGPTWVFYGDRPPNFLWRNGRAAPVLHLSRAQALTAAKFTLDRDYLVLTDDLAWMEGGKLRVSGGAESVLLSFPALPQPPGGFAAAGTQGVFTVYRRKLELPAATVSVSPAGEGAWDIRVDYPDESLPAGCDWLLELDFTGERMELFSGGEKINDYFYTGQGALLSLGWFHFPKALTARVTPLREEDRGKIFLERWPDLPGGSACTLDRAALRGSFCT